jgi:hypothetical protein
MVAKASRIRCGILQFAAVLRPVSTATLGVELWGLPGRRRAFERLARCADGSDAGRWEWAIHAKTTG